MQVLCIILNYKTPDMTLDAVRAARRALERIDGHRIDVVDNDSQDGSEEKLRAAVAREGWRDVRVLQTGHNGGFGYGNNYAIRRALCSPDPPEFVHILNSDAFPEPDAIEALLRFMRDHGEVGIAGSALRGVDGEPHISAFRFPTLKSEVAGSFRLGLLSRLWPDAEVPIRPRPERSREVDWLAGASMMIRREVLEEVGLFDETFFLYFEETDLCRRAKKAGWSIWYVVESRVVHAGHASTGLKDKAKPMPTYWFDSRRYYFLKNHGRAYLWAANAVAAAGLASFKVRARIQRKPDPDPVRYLRDFVHYNFVLRRP
ncbi:MAG TPA: glycosyltransferase family 2 protein [Sandaracinaceae bacterium]